MAASIESQAGRGAPSSFGQFAAALVVVTILAGAVGALFAARPAPVPREQAAKEAPPSSEAAAAPTSN